MSKPPSKNQNTPNTPRSKSTEIEQPRGQLLSEGSLSSHEAPGARTSHEGAAGGAEAGGAATAKATRGEAATGEPATHDGTTGVVASAIRRHLLLGWGGLLIVVLMGLVLEGLHAFKAPLYLLVENETRRLMWRLAHAHGGVLCVVSLAFAWTLSRVPRAYRASQPLGLGILGVPLGFFLGGVGAQDGDPSAGIILVPLGAACLLSGLGMTLVAVARQRFR